MKQKSKKFAAVAALLLAFPVFALGNGGDQRIVEGGKYFINMSRAPFTPRAGVKTAMLISIADGKTGRPIKDDSILRIRIFKMAGKGGSRELLFEQKDIAVKGGVLEFPYTFAESGLHEVFLDFALASEPDKIIEPPDFLMDVQKPEQKDRGKQNALPYLFAVLGFALGWCLRGIGRSGKICG